MHPCRPNTSTSLSWIADSLSYSPAKEADLVSDFCRHIKNWSGKEIEGYSLEFEYGRGRTDVIAITSCQTLIAVEAKLNRWDIAVQQAHRNYSFAHLSFILLPPRVALLALSYYEYLSNFGIGLCTLCGHENPIVLEVIPPRPSGPIQSWLHRKAIKEIEVK